MKSKLTLLFAAVLSTVTVSAWAGTAAAPSSSGYNWDGAYLGATAGYGWGTLKPGTISFYQPANTFQGSVAGKNYSFDGAVGGIEGGYNRQFGDKVIGAEVDFSGTDINGKVADSVNNYTAKSKADWLLTARARVGYAVDNTLVFVTGGLASAHIKTKLNDIYPGPTVVSTSDSSTYWGWTAGGGVEQSLGSNWSLKVEDIYVDLGKETYKFQEPVGGWPLISGKASITSNIARVGLNYKFD